MEIFLVHVFSRTRFVAYSLALTSRRWSWVMPFVNPLAFAFFAENKRGRRERLGRCNYCRRDKAKAGKTTFRLGFVCLLAPLFG